MVPVIYLDTNQWIFLAQCYNKSNDESSKYREVCEKILRLALNDKIILVTCLLQIDEINKQSNLFKRKEILDFIFKYTKVNTILSINEIIPLEVENQIRIHLGKELIDIKSKIFSQGCNFSQPWNLVPKNTNEKPSVSLEEMKKLVIEKLQDPEIISKILMNEEFHKKSQKQDLENITLVTSLESQVKKDYSHHNKKLNEKLAKIRTIDEFTGEHFIKICISKYKVDPRTVSMKIFSSLESVEYYFKQIRTAYIHFVLNHQRNMHPNPKIHKNDLFDLATLTPAVAYCDIVVGERKWINFLKQRKYNIENLYNTKLFSNINDLLDILPEF